MSDEVPAAAPFAPAAAETAREGRPRVPWQSILMVAGSAALTIGLLFVPADIVGRLGSFGYLGVFLLVMLSSATIVLPSPALGVALLAAKTLDPWLVGLVSGLAAGVGETTGYLAGRGGGEIALRSKHYPRIERWVARWGTLTIFVMAVIPTPIMDLAGIAAGALGMPYRRFLIACIAGKTLRFIGVAWAGYFLHAAQLIK